jgi:hypothetical protein
VRRLLLFHKVVSCPDCPWARLKCPLTRVQHCSTAKFGRQAQNDKDPCF